jgi:DNA-binding CsgD family transcriptional regulator/PAS domain-containing protein
MDRDPLQIDHGLVGRIHDCALDAQRWPEVLAELTEVLRGAMADLTVVDPTAHRLHVQALHNWPHGLVERVQRQQHLNPTLGRSATAVLNEPLCSSRDLDIDAFHRTEYWQRCFGDGDYHDYLVVLVARSATLGSSWGVLGSRSRGTFDDRDLAFARAVSPHIARAVRIARMLDFHRVQAQTLDLALDAVGAAAFIVDEHGQVVHANLQAQAELATARLLKRDLRGALDGATPAAAAMVRALRQCAARTTASMAPLRLATAQGAVFVADGVRLGGGAAHAPGLALLLLREHRNDAALALEVAAAHFGLTEAETRVLGEVLAGATLQEVASRLGVARSTVKTQLEAVYGKSGTRRRAELVRRVLTLTSGVRE